MMLVLALIAIGCADEQSSVTLQSKRQVTFNAAQLPTVDFTLPDMMCEEGCAEAVEDILTRQSGVRDVRVDFDAKTATVAVDEQSFDSQQAIAALVDKGFDNSALATSDAAATETAAPMPEAESNAAPISQ